MCRLSASARNTSILQWQPLQKVCRLFKAPRSRPSTLGALGSRSLGNPQAQERGATTKPIERIDDDDDDDNANDNANDGRGGNNDNNKRIHRHH